MKVEAKIKNPVHLKLKKKDSILLKSNHNDNEYSLKPGVMLGNEHYGIVIIVDYNNNQKETVYPTQCRVECLGIENGKLRIYEQYKKTPWIFNEKTGELEKSTFNDFTLEGIEKLTEEIEEYDGAYDEPIIRDPIDIKYIPNYPEKSIIAFEGLTQEKNEVALHPGVMLGGAHHGFRLTIESKNGTRELEFPTENRIVAVGQEDSNQGDIKIYENGKYHPWIFNHEGRLLQQAHYNEHSRRDQQFILEKKRKKK